MILNISRANQFQECRVKAYNWHELRLMAWREAEALMTGEAFHVGIAEYFSHRDIEKAQQAAEAKYRQRLEGQMILDEERTMIESQIELSKHMLEQYSIHYKNEPIQILMPEVKFMVPLPDTTHHCWYVHRLLYSGAGDDFQADGSHSVVGYAPCDDPRCFHPHYLTGRTDAVISWNNLIWLLEHKTATRTGDIFYQKFRLDKQTTGYLYGIWKQTGVKPHGFLLNVVKKPDKRVAERNPFAISFEREPFIREERTLLNFEREISMIANNYELAFRTGDIYKNEKSCTSYNRKCYYMDSCERGEFMPDEFRQRAHDYVDLAYYELLGLEPPAPEPLAFVSERSMDADN